MLERVERDRVHVATSDVCLAVLNDEGIFSAVSLRNLVLSRGLRCIGDSTCVVRL